MLTYKSGSDTAIIALHEIYGVNRHMLDVCEDYHARGYDVYCPNLLIRESPFSYDEHEAAYASFMANAGFGVASSVCSLVASIRSSYARIFLVGYSVGATVAWLVAGTASCNGIVCHYGTRIRDYADSRPLCPALLLNARGDKSFPEDVAMALSGAPGITVETLEGGHGFCDRHAATYNPVSAESARRLAGAFIEGLS